MCDKYDRHRITMAMVTENLLLRDASSTPLDVRSPTSLIDRQINTLCTFTKATLVHLLKKQKREYSFERIRHLCCLR